MFTGAMVIEYLQQEGEEEEKHNLAKSGIVVPSLHFKVFFIDYGLTVNQVLMSVHLCIYVGAVFPFST